MDLRTALLKIKGFEAYRPKCLKTTSQPGNAHFPPRKLSQIDEDGPSNIMISRRGWTLARLISKRRFILPVIPRTMLFRSSRNDDDGPSIRLFTGPL